MSLRVPTSLRPASLDHLRVEGHDLRDAQGRAGTRRDAQGRAGTRRDAQGRAGTRRDALALKRVAK